MTEFPPVRRLVLVDGSSYLFRAFYALPDLRTSRGEPTGAIRGVVAMLRRLVEDLRPEYFAVVFDAPGKTFRDDWYPQYKANRPPMPDDLGAQIEPLKELVRASGWPLLIVDGVEADDVIGTLACQASRAGIETVISTSDKDIAQLVDEHVTLVNTMSNEKLDRAGVQAKFGVRPDQVLDYLTLIGDSVDNVPGVPKVGPKTAAKWLAEHGTLEAIIASAGSFSGAIGENLRAALEWLPQGRRLLTVKTDCALPFGIEDLRRGAPDRKRLAELYERFEFRTWLREVVQAKPGEAGAGAPANGRPAAAGDEAASAPRAGGEAAAAGAAGAVARPDGGTARRAARPSGPSAVHAVQAPGADDLPLARSAETRSAGPGGEGGGAGEASAPPVRERRHECVLDAASFERWACAIEQAPLVCLDTQCTAAGAMNAELVGLAFSVEPGSACYIPLAHRCPGAPAQLSRDHVLGRLRRWLEDSGRGKLGQRTKHDLHVLANHGVTLHGVIHDTQLESYVLEAHKRHDLDDLAWRHLGVRTLSYEDVCGKGAGQIGFEQVAIDRATEFAAGRADTTLQVHRALWPRLEAEGNLRAVYAQIEIPVREVLARMERHGVLIDAQKLTRQSGELGARMLELEREAHALAGGPFNLGSPKQIQEVLFERMQLPVKKKTATGQPSTDEDVLGALAADYPLPRILLEHRAFSKLKSTYTDKLPQMIDPRTGRVHTHYSQVTAVTGRIASTDPNLQNIPVRTPEGRRIREAFVAPDGHRVLSADYSQIELRIMAHLSQDASLLAAFAEGADIHRATAAQVFSVAPAEVSAEQRRMIKAVNFGLIYGMSAFGLATQLGIERSAAQQFIDQYFLRYPGVADYMQRTRELARTQGYVETVFGRRLWLQDIRAASGPRRQAAERAAINAPMQGTAADLIKLAMIAVQRWLDAGELASRLVMQVHDELVLEVPDGELQTITRELPGLMAGVAELSVPLLVEVGSGPNWDTAH